ncbi:MAG TPA: MdtA/MuxA family multidrug efflux RND transporter periplasmic adaptor subunit [Rhodocyclaceae bacterium]|jgi:multidrug efflux system membrane fusion protein|nr:MdtA/MuxA family multidrug efflux RND transporter periplasmic adaptor subunit [Rhodocyclaceae bacterium]
MKPSQFIAKINWRTTLIAIVILAVIGAGGYFIIERGTSDSAKGGAGGRFGGMGGMPQPVAASPVKLQDVPIWINAIGTMIPRNLVTVQSRVAGELMKVNFTEGQLVSAGQVLAEIDPRPLQAALLQAQGQYERDVALLKNAQVDLERYRTLLAQDSVSRQQFDTQESLVRQYQGTVAVDRGAVANAKLQLDYARITAPVAGRVGLRQVDPGNQVTATSTNIVILAQVQPITAVFSVPEVNLPTVTQALASKTPTAVEVWDRDFKRKLAEGTLLTADNQIDTTTGTLKLKALFKNDDNSLFPNQFVNIKLSAGTATNAKVVPGSAVLRGAKGTFVYVINTDNKVTAVPVKTGPVAGDLITIEGDIQAGAQVVTDGADKLRDGAPVNVVTAAQRDKATSSDGVPKRGRHGQNGGQSGAQGSAQGGGQSGNPASGQNSGPGSTANNPNTTDPSAAQSSQDAQNHNDWKERRKQREANGENKEQADGQSTNGTQRAQPNAN